MEHKHVVSVPLQSNLDTSILQQLGRNWVGGVEEGNCEDQMFSCIQL